MNVLENYLKVIAVAIIFAFSMPVCLVSCNENGDNDPSISIELDLLDAGDVISTSFSLEEPIVFRLRMINNSDQDVLVNSFDQQELFKVYNSEGVPIGKPYKNAFCEYLGGYPITAKDTFEIKVSWIPKEEDRENYHRSLCELNYENPILEQGTYRTSLNSPFVFSILNSEFVLTPAEKTITFKITN